jgi:hypothetical protein
LWRRDGEMGEGFLAKDALEKIISVRLLATGRLGMTSVCVENPRGRSGDRGSQGTQAHWHKSQRYTRPALQVRAEEG